MCVEFKGIWSFHSRAGKLIGEETKNPTGCGCGRCFGWPLFAHQKEKEVVMPGLLLLQVQRKPLSIALAADFQKCEDSRPSPLPSIVFAALEFKRDPYLGFQKTREIKGNRQRIAKQMEGDGD